MLDSVWAWLTEKPPPLPVWFLALGLLLGLASTFRYAVWRRTRLLATWVHESGHALAAISVGFSVRGIRIEKDTSGVTHTAGPARLLPRVFITAAGYPAPAALGAVLLYLLLSDLVNAGVAIVIIAGLAMLPLQRSARGWGITLLILIGSLGLICAPTWVASLSLAITTGYLCAASPRTIWELRRHPTHDGEEEHSDADILGALTRSRPGLWQAGFLLLSLSLPIAAVLLALG